jgi:uncharacterized membrane protein
MRWLMIGLLVSLGGLLFVAAGVARHIWLRRGRLRAKPTDGTGPAAGEPLDAVEDIDLEVEP